MIPGQNCPPWCRLGDHDNRGPGFHRSPVIRVGHRQRHTDRGEASMWLEKDRHGPIWVGVQAAHMTSASVEVSLSEAALLWRQLRELLEAAGIDPVTGEPADR